MTAPPESLIGRPGVESKNLHFVRCLSQAIPLHMGPPWAGLVSPPQGLALGFQVKSRVISESVLGLNVLIRSGEVGKGERRQEGE